LATHAITGHLTSGEGPLGIAVNPRSGVVYVADWYRHEILAIDPDKQAIIRRVSVGKAPSGIAVSADGKLLLTADREDDSISFIDAEKFERIGILVSGCTPLASQSTTQMAAHTLPMY